MRTDRLGRRRAPGQERGLTPPHPELPRDWISKAIRVAMPDADWRRLDQLAAELGEFEPTQARALGAAISRLLELDSEFDQTPRHPLPIVVSDDWMDWERRKAMRLLRLAI